MDPAIYLINGNTMESLGVRAASRSLKSFGTSTVTLNIVDAELASPLIMGAFTDVTITRNGATFFKGKLRVPSQMRDGRSFGQSLVIEDAWGELEKQNYAQHWDGQTTQRITLGLLGTQKDTDATDAAGPFIGGSTQLSYSTFFSDLPQPAAQDDEFKNVLGFAQFEKKLDVQPGTINAPMPLLPRNMANVSLAEVMRILRECSPDVVSVMDYSASPPAVDIFRSSDVVTLAYDGGGIAKVEMARRDDLLVDEVNLHFDQLNDDGAIETNETQSAKSTTGNGGRSIDMSLGLPPAGEWTVPGDTRMFTDLPKALCVMPAGLAQAFVEAFGQAFWEGTIELVGDTEGGVPYLGKRINITGGQSAWATALAQVIGVTENLRTGHTTLQVGPGRNCDPKRALRGFPIVPAAMRANTGNQNATFNRPQAQSHEPHQVYLIKNKIFVAPGLVGRDQAGHEVHTQGTGTEHAVIGLGQTINIYLGVAENPRIDAFTLTKSDGSSFTEYRPVGVSYVVSSNVRTVLNPAPRPVKWNAQTGELINGVIAYWLLATVEWPVDSAAPRVQTFRKGNFDVANIPPDRVYLTALT